MARIKDLDADGKVEEATYDPNLDGVNEVVMTDADNDNRMETTVFDLNSDGQPDRLERDVNGDNITDVTIDLTGVDDGSAGGYGGSDSDSVAGGDG